MLGAVGAHRRQIQLVNQRDAISLTRQQVEGYASAVGRAVQEVGWGGDWGFQMDVLSLDDYLACRSFPDEICRNAYGIDVHIGSRERYLELCRKSIDELKELNRQVTKRLGKGKSFGVPYRCLTPKGLRNH